MVDDLEELVADDFEMLKAKIIKIQYNRLIKGMTQRGFTNVPSVPTCPPHPHGSSALAPPAHTALAQATPERVAVNSSDIEEPVLGQMGVEKGGGSGERGWSHLDSQAAAGDEQTKMSEEERARNEEEERRAKVSVLAARLLQSESEAEAQLGKKGCAWEPALTCSSRCTPIKHEE